MKRTSAVQLQSVLLVYDTSDLTVFLQTMSVKAGIIPCPLFFSDLDSARTAIAQCKFFCMVCKSSCTCAVSSLNHSDFFLDGY